MLWSILNGAVGQTPAGLLSSATAQHEDDHELVTFVSADRRASNRATLRRPPFFSFNIQQCRVSHMASLILITTAFHNTPGAS